MSSVARSIKCGILFEHMNKQQKKTWSSLQALRKREYEKEVGKEISERDWQENKRRILNRKMFEQFKNS